MERLASILILALIISAPIGELVDSPACLASQEINEFYSFENDMEGWSINGTDLSPNEPTADEWAITRSQEMAFDGSTAVKLDLTNNNDAGKIWIEKPFLVEPNRLYQVNVSYSFASADGSLGTFNIITGVLKQRRATFDDLIPAFRESTDKRKSKPGYRWLDKHYEFAVSSGQATSMWVVIGIWGTFSASLELARKNLTEVFPSFARSWLLVTDHAKGGLPHTSVAFTDHPSRSFSKEYESVISSGTGPAPVASTLDENSRAINR